MPAGWHLPPPPKGLVAARSLICSDHGRAEQEHRLGGVLLEPGPQVRHAYFETPLYLRQWLPEVRDAFSDALSDTSSLTAE